MRIKLLDTVHVPDETFRGEGSPPCATNYRGAVLTVSEAFGAKCIAAGKAEECAPPVVTEQEGTVNLAGEFDGEA